ncbi:MAG: EamA family transporter [Acidobacteriaceae bacterium]
MTFRKYLVLLSVVFFGSIGDTLLSRGMKDVGQIQLSQWTEAITAVGNPWVASGIVCLIIFFGSYLASLSWADLTYVLPATAIGYVVLALLSRFFLHEQISVARWAGIALITAGVGFVAGGPSQTARAEGQELAELVTHHENPPRNPTSAAQERQP